MNLRCLIFGHNFNITKSYIDSNFTKHRELFCSQCGKIRHLKSILGDRDKYR